MRWRTSVAGLASAAGLLIGSDAGATRPPLPIVERDYDCKIIASTRELPGLWNDDPPRMNAWGQVAFLTQDAVTSLTQIRVGHGDLDPQGHPITRLFAQNEDSSGITVFGVGKPTIEDGGFVVFGGAKTNGNGDGGPAIFRSPWFARVANGSAPVVEGVVLDPTSPYVDFPVVSTNSVSSLLFQSGDGPHRKLYVDSNLVAQEGAGGVQTLDDTSERIAPGNSSFYGYEALLDTGDDVIVLNGTVRDSVPQSGSVLLYGLAVNGNIVPVASWIRIDAGSFPQRWTLEFESDFGHATYVDSAIDAITPFYTYSFATSINAWNEVAFVATGNDGIDDSHVFVADGHQLVHVHCPNMQQTFGASFFVSTEISPRALDTDGQVAFLARTASPDETFLVRADPIAGQSARPAACTGLDDGTPCDDGNPVTLSSCHAQVCVGAPTGFATSCEGQPDYTACDAAGPGMQGYCASQSCVGQSPVPEPDLPEDAALAALAVLWLRPRRRL
jgi:hypothetical protein